MKWTDWFRDDKLLEMDTHEEGITGIRVVDGDAQRATLIHPVFNRIIYPGRRPEGYPSHMWKTGRLVPESTTILAYLRVAFAWIASTPETHVPQLEKTLKLENFSIQDDPVLIMANGFRLCDGKLQANSVIAAFRTHSGTKMWNSGHGPSHVCITKYTDNGAIVNWNSVHICENSFNPKLYEGSNIRPDCTEFFADSQDQLAYMMEQKDVHE